MVVGALPATDAPDILEPLGHFGHHVGMGIRIAQQGLSLRLESDSDHLTLPLLWARTERPDQWSAISNLISLGNLSTLKHELKAIGAQDLIERMIAHEKTQAQKALREIEAAINPTAYMKAGKILAELFPEMAAN